jgi:hypothetical protein
VREDHAAAAATLDGFPKVIRAARVTRVNRPTGRTEVHVRCTAAAHIFTMITAWDPGPEDRPWIVAIDTLDWISNGRPIGPSQAPPRFDRRWPLINSRRPRVRRRRDMGGRPESLADAG